MTLFDGGRRNAEINDSRTLLAEAELNLTKVEDEVTVQVESAYDKVEQLQDLVGVAEETLKVRTEAARLEIGSSNKTPRSLLPEPRRMQSRSLPGRPLSKQTLGLSWPRASSSAPWDNCHVDCTNPKLRWFCSTSTHSPGISPTVDGYTHTHTLYHSG